MDPDREPASRAYEALRNKLVDYFDWRGATSPDAMADETLDRIAKKLNEGEVVEHVSAYTYGIARRVLQEAHRRTSRERTAFRFLEHDTPPTAAEEDARLPCLKQCLQQLSEENRRIIMAYYDGEGRAHLSERKAVAERFKLSYAALKTRAHRVRGLLEDCLRQCVEGGEMKPLTVSGHS